MSFHESIPNFSGFTTSFFIGCIEDRTDPLKLGRLKVRILGIHTDDPTLIKTEDLPWQKVMTPINQPQMTGLGGPVTGPVPGTWVMLICMDANALQEFIVIGTLTGIPEQATQKPNGFSDLRDSDQIVETLETAPRKIQQRQYNYDGTGILLTPEQTAQNYPRVINPYDNILNESDVNRLARNEDIDDTIIGVRNSTLDTDVPVAFGESWSEPESPYDAEYPYNHVYESESGHIKEVDDTPGSERTHDWDRSGCFTEIGPDGTKIVKVTLDHFEIVMRNKFIHICANKDETIHESYNLYVQGDFNIQVDGNVNLLVKGSVYQEVEGDVNSTIGGNANLLVKGSVSEQVDGNVESTVGGNLNIKSGDSETHKVGDATTFNTGGKFSVLASEIDLLATGAVNIDGALVNINSGFANPDIAPEPNIVSPTLPKVGS